MHYFFSSGCPPLLTTHKKFSSQSKLPIRSYAIITSWHLGSRSFQNFSGNCLQFYKTVLLVVIRKLSSVGIGKNWRLAKRLFKRKKGFWNMLFALKLQRNFVVQVTKVRAPSPTHSADVLISPETFVIKLSTWSQFQTPQHLICLLYTSDAADD